jgi:hypothetical protein
MEKELVLTDNGVIDHGTKIFRGIKITAKGRVVINFGKRIIKPLEEGQDTNDEVEIDYQIKCNQQPHKDLFDAMKMLRKHALALAEIDVDTKALTNYTVIGFVISGDIEKQNSRIDMIIGHTVKRTGKIISIKTGQVVMYGDDSDYKDNEEMSKLVVKAINEVWLLVGGKFQEDDQLPLFV